MMSATASDLLRRNEPEVLEERGPLSYTDKQVRIIQLVLDEQDLTVEEIAERTGAHETYVRSILRRM